MASVRQADKVVRYAVAGQGYIAQAAVLPAFAHAKRNSRLVAPLVSGDATKRRELGRRYGVPAYSYAEYDSLLTSGTVDAGDPEPNGEEGLTDVRIVRALYRSAASGRAVKLGATRPRKQPDPRQEIRRPPVAHAAAGPCSAAERLRWETRMQVTPVAQCVMPS